MGTLQADGRLVVCPLALGRSRAAAADSPSDAPDRSAVVGRADQRGRLGEITGVVGQRVGESAGRVGRSAERHSGASLFVAANHGWHTADT
ncbi:MAG: hypothetical protein SNJ58_15105 [Aggregatilineales bacterium]